MDTLTRKLHNIPEMAYKYVLDYETKRFVILDEHVRRVAGGVEEVKKLLEAKERMVCRDYWFDDIREAHVYVLAKYH